MTAGKPRFFATPADFRAFLAAKHATAEEAWVGFHKRGSGKPSITWPESVDQALCFGWIDGVRKSLGATSYVIRFTPRKPTSIWSNVNTRRAEALIAEGQMTPAGLAAFQRRDAKRSGIYSFERETMTALAAAYQKRFEADRKAWVFFQKMPPWYRRTAAHFVMSAKKEETRLRRLDRLIADSAAGRSITELRRRGAPGKT